MSARVTVTTEATASPPPTPGVPSGKAFVAGVAQMGPANEVVRVDGLAAFKGLFGARAGGAELFDALTVAFNEGLSTAYVLRLTGPNATKAQATLDEVLIVQGKYVGAYANDIDAAWTQVTSTLTVAGKAVKGASVAALNGGLQAAGLPYVVSGEMPTADDTGTLVGGDDDADNADIIDAIALFDADLGDGAICVPGQNADDIASALQEHAASTNRLALVSSTPTASIGTVIADAAAIDEGESTVLVWPYVVVEDAYGERAVDPVGFAMGVRARAHSSGSPAQSPVMDIYGSARYIKGVVYDTTAAEWQALNAAGVSVIRSSNNVLRQYGWRTVDAPDGVVTLQPAQHRDTLNAVAVACNQEAEAFVGRIIDGKGIALGEFGARLRARLARFGAAFYAGENDPGYVVDVSSAVNSPEQIAQGRIHAAVGVRLAPGAEFIFISITASDAASVL